VRRLLTGPAEDLRAHTADTVEGRNYRNLVISGSWVGLIEGGINTYLPVFLARLGATPTVMGLLTSGQFLIGTLAYIPGGAYAERHTDQVRLANITSIITRSAYLLIALLPLLFSLSDVPAAAIIVWALAGIPTAVFTPSFFTVVQQAVPLRWRAQFLGFRWAAMTTVSAISIPLFGVFLDHTPFVPGYQVVFMISFVAALLHMVNFGRVRVPPFVRQRTADQVPRGLLAQARQFLHPFAASRLFVRYSLATVGFRLALYLPYSLYSIYWVDNLHATDTVIGLRGGVGYALLAVGYIVWGRLANRWGDRRVLLVSGLGFGLYPLLTALVPSMEWLPLAAAIWGLTGSGLDIGLFGMMMALSPEDKRPRFIAATYVLSSATSFVGPLLGAALAGSLGVRGALLLGGALQIASALLFLRLPCREEISENGK
jgi:MFS family permease